MISKKYDNDINSLVVLFKQNKVKVMVSVPSINIRQQGVDLRYVDSKRTVFDIQGKTYDVPTVEVYFVISDSEMEDSSDNVETGNNVITEKEGNVIKKKKKKVK